MTNKRQHERLEIAIPVVLVHQGKEIAVQTKNVSLGGMLIDGATELPYGATVQLKTTLPPNGQVLDATCTVRWIQGGAVGLQFGSLRAKETWALNQLVKLLGDSKPT